jgi:hypothetical protein
MKQQTQEHQWPDYLKIGTIDQHGVKFNNGVSDCFFLCNTEKEAADRAAWYNTRNRTVRYTAVKIRTTIEAFDL